MRYDELGIIGLTDSYKAGHWKQYPEDAEVVHSYFESRGGRWPFTMFFGLQYYLKKYFTTPVTHEMIDLAAPRLA